MLNRKAAIDGIQFISTNGFTSQTKISWANTSLFKPTPHTNRR